MDKDVRVWLYDVLNAIAEIDSFFEGAPMEFEWYRQDLKTKRAVERNIEIIGEALSRVLRNNDNIKITSARKIVDTRNRIIHGYDAVSDEILWGIMIKHLPVLQEEVRQLLGE